MHRLMARYLPPLKSIVSGCVTLLGQDSPVPTSNALELVNSRTTPPQKHAVSSSRGAPVSMVWDAAIRIVLAPLLAPPLGY